MSTVEAPIRVALPPLRHAQLIIDLVRNDLLPTTDPYERDDVNTYVLVPILGADQWFNADALTHRERYRLVSRLLEAGVFARYGETPR